MKNLKRNFTLAFTAVCAPLFIGTFCETAVAMEGHVVRAPASGYLSDNATTRAQGGVGNYLFRYIKEPAARVTSIEDEFSYSSQSSALREDENLEKKLFFKHDSSDLSENGRAKIYTVANELKENPSKTINIDGYADATGGENYNINLSERRAQTVVKELRGQGVSTSQLRWQGRGVQDPVGNNSTENGRMKNRRVEISVE